MLNQQLSETALRVLIAPDSFKGSLPAGEVADAISRGWRLVRSNDDVRCRPLADGGEGTLDAIAAAVPGARFIRVSDVAGPNGRRKEARYLQPPERVALLELPQTSGLPDPSQRDPLSASTRGLGELLDVALGRGAQRVIIALGGSATTDGALGAMRALGLTATDEAAACAPRRSGARSCDPPGLLSDPAQPHVVPQPQPQHFLVMPKSA